MEPALTFPTQTPTVCGAVTVFESDDTARALAADIDPHAVGNARSNDRGFTLIELIVLVALLAILAAVGAPALMTTLRNNESTTQTNDFIAALHLARSTAVTKRKPVTVCASTDGATCTATTNWASGYIVLSDSAVIRAQGTLDGAPTLQEAASTHTVTFNPYGEADTALQFTLTPPNCSDASIKKRLVNIEVTGRVNASTSACP